MEPATPAGPAPLSEVLTIPQVAKRAKWSTQRMRRFLMAKHAELDGGLLVDIGQGEERPRWTITLTALQSVAPQWFIDPEALKRQIDAVQEENEMLRARVYRLERIQEMHSERFAAMREAKKVAQLRPTG